jgi:1-phosphofructokinase family hexose kinase
MNPAVDRMVLADRLVYEDRGYILSRRESAGGRGINASAVIHAFGGRTLAIAPCGGDQGERFKELLGCCEFPVHLVPIHKNIRANLIATDRSGLMIRLNEKGPELDPGEVARIEEAVYSWLGRARWLMLCGSLPPGVPADFYSKLIVKARESGVKTLVDTDGECLLEAVEAKPTTVSPNQIEAERLLHQALLTRVHFLEAAEKIRAMGPDEVVLTLGARGAVGAAQGELYEVQPPIIDAVSPIGAGDALAAAFVWARENGSDFPDAIRWGVATGTASARVPGSGFATLEQTKEIYQQTKVRKV